MSFDIQSVDAAISALGWALGLSFVLIGGSIFGFTVWWARALESPSLGKLIGRAGLAFFAVGLLSLGVVLIGISTEALMTYPFGPSSGGTALYGYLLGLRLTTFEFAVSYALLRRHAARTDSGLSEALAALTFTATAAAWTMTALLAFIVVVTTINMLAFAFGWSTP